MPSPADSYPTFPPVSSTLPSETPSVLALSSNATRRSPAPQQLSDFSPSCPLFILHPVSIFFRLVSCPHSLFPVPRATAQLPLLTSCSCHVRCWCMPTQAVALVVSVGCILPCHRGCAVLLTYKCRHARSERQRLHFTQPGLMHAWPAPQWALYDGFMLTPSL